MLLSAAPVSAAMYGERVSRRDVIRDAFRIELEWMNECDKVTGPERTKCLNDARMEASKNKPVSQTSTRTMTDDGMMMEKTMTNPAMTRTMTRTKTGDGMMMEKTMTRNGVEFSRVSKRFVKRSGQDKRKELVKKCSDLLGTEKGVCLNPKLAKMMPKKEEKKMMAQTMWYMLDANAKLWWSTDGKEWSESETGTWMDKDGNWLKVMEGKLVWSADQGTTWTEVPEWTWMAGDGVWYKFDADWKLWWSKDNGTTWSEVPSKSWPGM